MIDASSLDSIVWFIHKNKPHNTGIAKIELSSNIDEYGPSLVHLILEEPTEIMKATLTKKPIDEVYKTKEDLIAGMFKD